MAYPEVLLPPSIRPASPIERTLADDGTINFIPRFGRGTTQRQVWGDPLQSFRVRFEALRTSERARIMAALAAARGGAANIRFSPGIPLRGALSSPELFVNADFASGTSNWGVQAGVLASADGVLKVTASLNQAGAPPGITQSPPVEAYVPYAMRAFAKMLTPAVTINGPYLVDPNGYGPSGLYYSALNSVLKTAPMVSSAAGFAVAFPLVMASGTYVGGDIGELHYASMARCALVDNSPNALTYSDQFDNAAWTKSAATIVSDAQVSPNGTTTADALQETATTSVHGVSQAMSVPSSATDITCHFDVLPGTRTWAFVQWSDNTAHSAGIYVNLSTGAVGSTATSGSNVTNARAHVEIRGGGWVRIHVTVRKSGSQTTMYANCFAATSDGVSSYLGVAATNAIYLWRSGAAQSSVPTRGAQTTSAATTGTAQSGSTLYLKGLPASTSGLLLPGDWFEINGELKQATAALNSDGAGLGVLHFGPGLITSPADNDPVIFNNPMGRFRLASDPRITERFGLYTDIEFDLIEAMS